MDIYQLIHGVDNQSAGPTYSVSKLAEGLNEYGHKSEIISLGDNPEVWNSNSVLNNYVPHGMGRFFGYNKQHFQYIRDILEKDVVVHGHGVWRFTNLFPLFIKKPKAKLICSPRGMLTPWSMRYKKWMKLPFWQTIQKPALQKIDCFHVTSEMELEDLRTLGFKQPAVIIPNGVDIPVLPDNLKRKKQIVFLSRIDPKKGLDILLPVWSEIFKKYSDWSLKIIGPLDSTYAQSMIEKARLLNLNNIEFTGALHGKEKYNELTQSSLFVLPTYSENFGLVVAEAFAHGLPVITTTETPWLNLEERKCGWTIKPNEKELFSVLIHVLENSKLFKEYGENGRKWMKQEFSWKKVTKDMLNTYESIV